MEDMNIWIGLTFGFLSTMGIWLLGFVVMHLLNAIKDWIYRPEMDIDQMHRLLLMLCAIWLVMTVVVMEVG